MASLSFTIEADDQATPVVKDVQVAFEGLGDEIVDALKRAE